jgi:hypothetical protein
MLKGSSFLTVFMIKNSLVGIINSILKNDFKSQINCLILLEGIYLGIVLLFFLSLKIYHLKTKVFVLLIVSIVKIVLMISLYADKN